MEGVTKILDLYKTKRKREPIKIKEGREICNMKTVLGARVYKNRTRAMAFRQKEICPLCNLGFTEGNPPTFDHQSGRGAAGAWRDDRLEIDGKWHNAAVHESCNVKKGSKRYHWKDGKYVPMEVGPLW